MILIFPDNLKTSGRRPVSLAATGNPGRCCPVFRAVEIRFLFAEIDDDGSPAGMPFRHVRCDQVGDGAAAGHRRSDPTEREELNKSICHDFNRATLEEADQSRT